MIDPAIGDHLEKVMRFALRGYDDIKPLWRMSKGNKAKAMEIIKLHTHRYTVSPEVKECKEFEQIFDIVMADLYGDGCELEWVS